MNQVQPFDLYIKIPVHIAIVMDGNGRWAQEHGKPRLAGHAAGVEALRRCVKSCINLGVRYLTAFAFSSENWRRPDDEVSGIMQLFIEAIQSELADLNYNHVELRFIGDKKSLPPNVVQAMNEAELSPVKDPNLTLIVAMNYGGRWDILQAALALREKGLDLTEDALQQHLTTTQYAPEPDLIIRTGGELRISNFLLWQAAYAELYFIERLWPDFSEQDLRQAIINYTQRERRFGALLQNE